MPSSIDIWLEGLGLSKYSALFAENEIGLDVLPDLSDPELKDLGIPLGDRKRLLKAFAARLDRPGEPTTAQAMPARLPEAERRQLTVMFCDLVGSTALSTELDPEDLREVMRRYQDAVAGAVTRYGGHVAKYLGDGVLAYFGWPHAHEDQAERAVRAGLDAVGAVSEVTLDGGGALRARAGIATGQVVVGDLIGTAGRDTEAVSGETPNLAARLQDVIGAGRVAVGDATRRLIGETFKLKDLGFKTLKGFAEPVPVWQVLREAAVESRFEAAHGATLTRFIGRENELGLLLDRWARAKSGEGQVVLLSGEAGIGKSRLVQALQEAIAAEPQTRLRYQCSPYHANSTLHPVIRQLERAADFAPDDDRTAKLDKLEAVLATPGSAAPETASLFANLLSLPAEERYGPLDLSPQQRKAKTLEALVAQLRTLAAREPVFFFVEDAHWIDPTTQEFLEQTVGQIEAMPVLLVITHRPEYQPSYAGQIQVSALSLNRLGRDQVVEMIRAVAGDEAEWIVGPVTARAEGIPLFVEELTKSVLEAGLGAAGDAMQVPESLQALLLARLDKLGEVKELAQIGAVIGREFSHDLLSAVVEGSADELAAGLDRLVRSQLVLRRGTPPDASYFFKHALVQDAAYDSLLRRRRHALHRRIAEVMEEHVPEVVRVEPEVLAHHWLEAGERERALPLLLKAGRRAGAHSANEEAVAHLRRGLVLLETMGHDAQRDQLELDFFTALGPPLMTLRGYGNPEVGRVFRRALELCPQPYTAEVTFPILWNLWLHNQITANLPEAARLADHVMRLMREDPSDERVLEAHHASWTTAFSRGHMQATHTHAEAGLATYVAEQHHKCTFVFGGHDAGVCGHAHAGLALSFLGFADRALGHGHQSVSLAQQVDHGPSLSIAKGFLSLQHFVRQEAATLLEVSEDAMSTGAEFGPPHIRALSQSLNGWAKVMLGQAEEGIGLIENAIAQFLATGGKLRKSYYLLMLADAYRHMGHYERALTTLADVHRTIEENEERVFLAEALRLKGQVLLQQAKTNLDGAEALFLKALGVAQERGAKLLELRAAVSLTRVYGEQGRHDDAGALLKPHVDGFTEGFDTPDLKEAKTLLHELR